MFVVREKDKVRPILNCQRINQFIQCQHFKMESVPILRDLIEAGDWMCKIDLKDAYTMVPIHPESRQYLFFPSPWYGLPIQVSTLWHECCVESFLQTHEFCDRIIKNSRHSNSVLLRRYLSISKNEGRNVQECSDDVNSPEQARIHHQLFQKQAYTEEDTNFLGFQFNTKTMTISVPTTKMEKLTSRVKQLLKSPTKEIMPLVSKFDWKNYCNDSSDGRCAPTCTASSKGPSQEPTPTTTELGSSMPIVSRFTTGTRMVTDDEFKTKWVAHTHRQQQTGRIAKARLHHSRRCFRLRLGNKFGINKNPWLR